MQGGTHGPIRARPFRRPDRNVRRVRAFLALGLVQVGACNDHGGCGIVQRLSKEVSPLSPDPDPASPPATPGATSVQVPQFIDLILSEWASDDENAAFLAGLTEIDARAAAVGARNIPTPSPTVLRFVDLSRQDGVRSSAFSD